MARSQVLADLPARIKAAAEDVRDAKDAYDLALAQRDELIVDAIDQGMSQLKVADLAGVRKGRISAILANSQAGDDE